MTGLRGQVRGYLALRRAMGFKMEKHGLLLTASPATSKTPGWRP